MHLTVFSRQKNRERWHKTDTQITLVEYNSYQEIGENKEVHLKPLILCSIYFALFVLQKKCT